MITVIIPALNEEKCIQKVIRMVRRNNLVSEIIVVDDQSEDNTVRIAKAEQARVITSTVLGKGSSMREGMMLSKNEILVFLDADIPNYSDNIIHELTQPIISGKADFVKSYFTRQAGRVTEILVKPLLELFFPHLIQFKQPLSGMIAGRKSFFEKVSFENDYGVDIGLLIDMHKIKARICEVCIGEIENDMQPLLALGRMARQVANAIFKRVNMFNPDKEEKQNEFLELKREQVELAITRIGPTAGKMIVFGSNSLLRESFVEVAATQLGFESKLQEIMQVEVKSHLRASKIASLFKGASLAELINILENIPLITDAARTIRKLQDNGYICGIISNGFHCIANHIRNLTGLDFSIGNELEFKNSIATGYLRFPTQLLNDKFSPCEHKYCKANMFLHIIKRAGINIDNTIAVGRNDEDLCILRSSGYKISFNSQSDQLNSEADIALNTHSLLALIEIAV
jgi:phosphoserine phosphatase